MDYLTVHTLGPALIKALGAPPLCTRLELRIAFDEVPTVTCEYYPTGDDGTISSLTTLLAEYELVPRPKLHEGEIMIHPLGGAPYAMRVHPGGSPEFQGCRAEVIGFDAWMRERTNAAHRAFMLHIGAKVLPLELSIEGIP